MLDSFRARRNKLLEAMGPGSVAILRTAPVRPRSNDTDFKFRPDSNFFYLTGWPEPEAVAVLRPPPAEEPFLLFVLPRDREKETWTGRRIGPEGARSRFGADAAFPLAELDERIVPILGAAERLFYRMGKDERFDARVLGWIEKLRGQARLGVSAPSQILDPGATVHEHRLRKSAEELEALRRAAEITGEAHRAAMRSARPGAFEYELEAEVDYVFRKRGGFGPGYATIVASGPNATILHHTSNDRRLEKGDLLLLDAGCEFDLYTADVTRTFPVSGRFTEDQRAIYEAVLEAQLAAIECVRPGARFQDAHDEATRVLVRHLLALGILAGDASAVLEKGDHKRFFMHRTSHWLGMDVHDCGSYFTGSESRTLEPGMVLTVEPGLYFAEDDEQVDPRWRGIGVRIEDDVHVTESGREVLTDHIPKSPGDVEAAVRA